MRALRAAGLQPTRQQPFGIQARAHHAAARAWRHAASGAPRRRLRRLARGLPWLWGAQLSELLGGHANERILEHVQVDGDVQCHQRDGYRRHQEQHKQQDEHNPLDVMHPDSPLDPAGVLPQAADRGGILKRLVGI